jgi:hypothetical protein
MMGLGGGRTRWIRGWEARWTASAIGRRRTADPREAYRLTNAGTLLATTPVGSAADRVMAEITPRCRFSKRAARFARSMADAAARVTLRRSRLDTGSGSAGAGGNPALLR